MQRDRDRSCVSAASGPKIARCNHSGIPARYDSPISNIMPRCRMLLGNPFSFSKPLRFNPSLMRSISSKRRAGWMIARKVSGT